MKEEWDLEQLAAMARAEIGRRKNEALALDDVALGKGGGCHVVAQILKEIFPTYRIVGVPEEGNRPPKHVGCAFADSFIDIEGIRPLPAGAQICEPVDASNPVYHGYFTDREFMEAVRARLEPYIRSRVCAFDAGRISERLTSPLQDNALDHT